MTERMNQADEIFPDDEIAIEKFRSEPRISPKKDWKETAKKLARPLLKTAAFGAVAYLVGRGEGGVQAADVTVDKGISTPIVTSVKEGRSTYSKNPEELILRDPGAPGESQKPVDLVGGNGEPPLPTGDTFSATVRAGVNLRSTPSTSAPFETYAVDTAIFVRDLPAGENTADGEEWVAVVTRENPTVAVGYVAKRLVSVGERVTSVEASPPPVMAPTLDASVGANPPVVSGGGPSTLETAPGLNGYEFPDLAVDTVQSFVVALQDGSPIRITIKGNLAKLKEAKIPLYQIPMDSKIWDGITPTNKVIDQTAQQFLLDMNVFGVPSVERKADSTLGDNGTLELVDLSQGIDIVLLPSDQLDSKEIPGLLAWKYGGSSNAGLGAFYIDKNSQTDPTAPGKLKIYMYISGYIPGQVEEDSWGRQFYSAFIPRVFAILGQFQKVSNQPNASYSDLEGYLNQSFRVGGGNGDPGGKIRDVVDLLTNLDPTLTPISSQ